MDKKIGNVLYQSFLLSFLILSVANFAYGHNKTIDVVLLDKQQMPLKKAEVGIPFLLQLIAENMETVPEPEGLQGSQDCSVQYYGTSQSVSIINGFRTQRTMYNFLVTCETKGTFELGPVSLKDSNGDVLKTDKIIISVGDLAEPTYNNREPFLFVIEPDKKTAYVGEKVTVFVRFCYQKNFENLAIDNFVIKGARIGYQSNVWQKDTITIGSTEYDCKQVLFEIYPEKTGTLIIPAMQATFIPEHNRAQQLSGSMFSLFGLASTRAVQSHPRSIDVKALPNSSRHKNVTAIGDFDKATLSINSKQGQVGEGLVIKMIVEGDGNLEIVKTPQLQLPDGLYCYEGNCDVRRIDSQHEEKTFEWIVQAEHSGTFEIPQQHFYYFDPIKKIYKELKTSGLTLTISGESMVKKEENNSTATLSTTALPAQPTQTLPEDVNQFLTGSVRSKDGVSSLLSSAIVLLIVLLMVIGLAILVRPYWVKTFLSQKLYYRYKFWKVCRQNSVQELYHFFQELADEYGFSLQDDSLQAIFEKLGLEKTVFENWQNFVTMLLESNFAKMKSPEDVELALHLAKQWFPIILSCCNILYKNRFVTNNTP